MTKAVISKRLSALRDAMKKEAIDLVALGPGAHMHWLLGFHPHADERPCLLLVGAEAEVMLMPALNAEGSRQNTDIAFYKWSDDEGPTRALNEALEALGQSVTNVALDETMRADFALLLLAELPQASHSFTTTTVSALRMRKDETEFAELKMNAGLADEAMQAAFAAIKEGMTELEVAEVIKASFASNGARPLFSVVGASGNGAFPHHQTGSTKLKAADAIVIDLGASKGDFSSDITRMAILKEAPEGYQEVHDVVERAVQAAMQAARPGVAAKVVDDAARSVITEAGYGEYFVHRTGHGLGIEIHEAPYLTSSSETILEEGMVFSIEPGIYLPGRFGIRLEDIVILRKDGPEIFSTLSRNAHLIA